LFNPQHLAAPLRIAHEWLPPAESAVTVGVGGSVVVVVVEVVVVEVVVVEVVVVVGAIVVVVVVEVVEVVVVVVVVVEVVVLAAWPGALGLGPLMPTGPAHTADAALLSAATVARTTSVLRFIRSLPVSIRL
jgi:hypothetical protein